NKLTEIAGLLKTEPHNVVQRVHSLVDELKELERQNESLLAKLANQEIASLVNQVEKVNGINVVAAKVEAGNMNQMRNIVDQLKHKWNTAVILLAAENKGKVQLIAGVTADLVTRNLHAGHLIKEAAKVCGGGGGGRPDMAQAGGKDATKIDEALTTVYAYVKEHAEKKCYS